MKLFKKVLAVVLVGAMAVSMLTACSSNEVSKVKDALKDAGIAHNSAMTADGNEQAAEGNQCYCSRRVGYDQDRRCG